MSTPVAVARFYEEIWDRGRVEVASELLTDGFVFRGSLGNAMEGRAAFIEYVRSVHEALDDYRCEVLDCVTEGDRAFAKMRFSGRHVGSFRGFPPTGKPVDWLGAALFRFDGTQIAELWVLGDLNGLDALLVANQAD